MIDITKELCYINGNHYVKRIMLYYNLELYYVSGNYIIRITLHYWKYFML